MFLTVFGPGLALRGPVGSMTRAVDGMRREQDSTLYSFIGLVVFLGISMIASFWSWMTEPTAAFLTFIFTVQTFFWYQHSVRIYNRFKYDAIDVSNFGESSTQQARSLKLSHLMESKDPLYTKALQAKMEGFLMVMTKTSGLIFSSVSWERKYFVLKDMVIRSYKKKSDYETSAEDVPILNTIDMHFMVFRLISEREIDGTLKIVVEPETVSAGDDKERYTFICDSEEEFDKWIVALDTVLAGARRILEEESRLHQSNSSDESTLFQGFVDIR